MSELVSIAELVLVSAQRRQEIAAENVSHLGTPGYRASVSFSEVIEASSARANSWDAASGVRSDIDFTAGSLQATGQALDLAISGAGFFRLESETGSFLTRDGRFQLDEDGRVVNASGLRLQTDQGSDLILRSDAVEILSDGVVLDDGLPVGRIGLYQLAQPADLEAFGGAHFRVGAAAPPLELSSQSLVRQGMLEGSNVELTAQMLDVVATQRQMEIGAQLVRTYDTLLGQAISAFGRGRG